MLEPVEEPMNRPRAVVCAYSSVGTEALQGLLEAGIEVAALYTYAQGPDERWFTPPAVVAEARAAIPGLLDGTAPRIDQKRLGPSTYFGGRKPADSRLDSGMTVQEAFNQIRAVADPWPNAFLETPEGVAKVAWALPCAEPCPPGRIRLTREGVLLGFADGALRLHTLKHEGQTVLRPSEQADLLLRLGFPLA
jgi:methionyl-tRNA formyltransferase